MRTYAFPLYAISFVLFFAAWLLRPWGLLLLWPGLAYFAVASAYMLKRHRIFGKRCRDGRLSPFRVAIFLPYLLLSWWIWRFRIWLWQEDSWNEILPELYLGRRLLNENELPPDTERIVDLTTEFGEKASVRKGREYHCLPTLDGSAPESAKFFHLVRLLAGDGKRTYVHCAIGMGRSATLVCGVLLARGLARTPGAAVHQVREIRRGIVLGRRQYRLLSGVLEFSARTGESAGEGGSVDGPM